MQVSFLTPRILRWGYQMCSGVQFCIHYRVCVFIFFKIVKFVVPRVSCHRDLKMYSLYREKVSYLVYMYRYVTNVQILYNRNCT
jgi:hypothetical protein